MLYASYLTFLFYFIPYLFSYYFVIDNKYKFINTSNTILFGSYCVYSAIHDLPYYNTNEDTIYKTSETALLLNEIYILRNLVDMFFIYKDDNNYEMYIHHLIVILFNIYYYNISKYQYYVVLFSFVELSSFFLSLTFTIKYYLNNKMLLITSGLLLILSYLLRFVVMFYSIVIFNYNFLYYRENQYYIDLFLFNFSILTMTTMSSVWFIKLIYGFKKELKKNQ
jgi:hypothetical protein